MPVWSHYHELLIALLITAAAGMAMLLLRALLLRHLGTLAQRTEHRVDDMVVVLVRHTHAFFLWALALEIGSWQLTLPPTLRTGWKVLFVSLLVLQGALWANAVLDALVKERIKAASSPTIATTYDFLSSLGKVIIWSLAALLILDNIPGVEISTLLASLGIGGVAIALAVQNVLSDLFAYLSIALDKPFAIGDFIAVDELMGTVEYIGLRSTRLLSVSGEQLIFSNHDLVSSRIRNYGRMEKRRATFSVGVTYETPVEKLEKVPDLIREIVEAQKGTQFERAFLKTMGDSALIYEVVYYLTPPDYSLYVQTQEAINLALLQRFGQEGIEIAYPTQRIYLSHIGTSA